MSRDTWDRNTPFRNVSLARCSFSAAAAHSLSVSPGSFFSDLERGTDWKGGGGERERERERVRERERESIGRESEREREREIGRERERVRERES